MLRKVSALLLALIAFGAIAQDRDPFAPKGERKSPDGRYEWIIRPGNPIQFQLLDKRGNQVLATVDSEFMNDEKFARATGFYWNSAGTVTILDELNYRRAGRLYAYAVADGNTTPVPLERFVPDPPDAEVARLTAEAPWDAPPPKPLGWVSSTQFRLRQAMKLRNGEITTVYYLIDFRNPRKPVARRER
jgi:hypothetical protein